MLTQHIHPMFFCGVGQNVQMQMLLKYSNSEIFRLVSEMEPFAVYVRECAQICWDLCVQTPPMLLDYHETEFNEDLHTRFYNSDMSSTSVLLYHCQAAPKLSSL